MASALLRIVDQTLSGQPLGETLIEFEKNSVSLKDIIKTRVEMEVNKYNEKMTEYYNGLVQPLEAEKTLNGYKMKKNKKIDAEMQVYIALQAFQKNGYFVLVDNQQANNLDEAIQITSETKVSFIKLTPLVGG